MLRGCSERVRHCQCGGKVLALVYERASEVQASGQLGVIFSRASQRYLLFDSHGLGQCRVVRCR